MFRPKYPDTVQPEYTTLCGVHVRLLASTLATFYIVCAVVALIGSIVEHHAVSIPVYLILIAFYISVLVADKYEQPFLYLPFLFLQAILLLIMVLVIFLLIVGACMSLDFIVDSDHQLTDADRKHAEWQLRIAIIIGAVVFIFALLFGIYVWKIVYRARNYMVKEVTSGKVERNAAAIGYDFNQV